MKVKINQLRLDNFEKFYSFAKDFVLNQFLDYPSRVRRIYWEKEFNRTDLRKKIKKGQARILTAIVEAEIVGFGLLEIDNLGGIYLSWLCVDKGFRGKGIGSSLLERVDKLALQRKCHFIYLYTENGRNIDFYKKRGFDLVGLHKESWCGMDEYIMQKNISKPFPGQWRIKK